MSQLLQHIKWNDELSFHKSSLTDIIDSAVNDDRSIQHFWCTRQHLLFHLLFWCMSLYPETTEEIQYFLFFLEGNICTQHRCRNVEKHRHKSPESRPGIGDGHGEEKSDHKENNGTYRSKKNLCDRHPGEVFFDDLVGLNQQFVNGR